MGLLCIVLWNHTVAVLTPDLLTLSMFAQRMEILLHPAHIGHTATGHEHNLRRNLSGDNTNSSANDRALKFFQSAIEIAGRLYDSKDKGAGFRYDYLLAQYSLARHLSAAGDASAARRAYSRCLDLARQAVRARPSLSEGILVGSLLKDMAVGSMAVPAEDVTAYRDYVESLASDADAGSDTLRTRGREVRSPREVLIQHYETLAAILRMRPDGAPATYE